MPPLHLKEVTNQASAIEQSYPRRGNYILYDTITCCVRNVRWYINNLSRRTLARKKQKLTYHHSLLLPTFLEKLRVTCNNKDIPPLPVSGMFGGEYMTSNPSNIISEQLRPNPPERLCGPGPVRTRRAPSSLFRDEKSKVLRPRHGRLLLYDKYIPPKKSPPNHP